MEGNIDVLINRLNDMGSILKKRMERPLLVAGEVVRTNIIKGIQGQKYNFAPLAESTVEQKARKKYSDLILIAQGDYMASFAVHAENWDEIHVGSNHDQGRRLEFGYPAGTNTITPARPHVGPALEESQKKIEKILADAFEDIFE